MKKRIFALFLCLCMVMTLLPVSVFADGAEAQAVRTDDGASVMSIQPVETPNAYITFKFYNADELLDTQIVNSDGSLIYPATPALPGGQRFLGWYVVNADGNYAADPLDLGTAYSDAKAAGNSEVTVKARFDGVFYVYFMTTDGKVHSTATATEANGYKVTPPTDYEPAGKVVTGWKANSAAFTADTVVTADTYVYPSTADCYWVTFNTTGGSMVASRSVTNGETLDLDSVTAPTRTGYDFKGWSLSENGTLITSITPTADTTLYAVWEGKNVNYTVVYWGENADDTNYSALATASLTGKVGATVTLNASTGALPSTVSDRQHFKFSSSDSATILADGSSVLNVYFSRNSYTLTFRVYDGGYIFGSYETVATITAKYNASIFAEFGKAPFNTTYKGRAWECTDSSKYGYPLQTLDRMPGFNATFDLYKQSSKVLKTIYYYVQDVGTTVSSSNWPTSNVNFTLYKEVTTYFNYATYAEEYHNIDGFERYSAKVAGFSNNQKNFSRDNTLSLYYLRKSYTLTFNNYGNVTDNTVEYEAKLDSYNNYVPARPNGFSENSVFMGWYEVEPSQINSTTQRFDFAGKTMPADNLILYAYWVEQPVTLTVQVPSIGYDEFNSEIAIGTVISSVDVFKAAEAAIAEAGKTVLKWVYADGSRADVNSAIGSDTTIKAIIAGEIYGVTYVTNTDDVISDENGYEYEALAQVKDGSTLQKDGNVFAYWTDDAGNIYYPGSCVTMTGNVTLTANYVAPSTKVDLTYHANYTGNDEAKIISAVPNNGTVTVMDYAATGMTTRPGYEFKGWADAADAAEANYAAGSEARLDNDGSNDLYAVWAALDVDYTVEFYYQNTDGTYPETTESKETRQGKTDSTVSVTDADKADKDNGKYVYDTAAFNIESGTVAADGSLVLKLYFKLNQSSYTVRYLWNGTGDKVADDNVVADQTVGQTITENPITVGGYTAVSTDSQSITLVPDSSSNVITFYYYKNVELTANSAAYEYNGSERSVSGFAGAPEDAGFSAITVGAAGTDVGEYPASFAEGTVGTKDSTGKYIVVKATDGMLRITPKSNVITITANSAEKPYDGTALTDSGYSFTQGILVRDDVLHVSVKGSQTNFGSSANVVTSYKVMRGGTDVTGNYTFAAPVNGTLSVTKREVTLTSATDSKQYDGTPLTNGTVTVSGKGFVGGEGATYTVTGSQTLAGSSENTFTYTLNEGTNPDNYDIITVPGTLTVTPVSDKVVVTIKEHSGTAKYDGSEKTVTGYDTEISNPLYTTDDFRFTGDATITGTDAGSYDMELVPENFENISNNFSNVEFVIEDGKLTISKREVTLTSATDNKMYDASPLTNHNVTVSGDGFVEGESATYTFTGSQTDVGSSENTFSYELNEGTKDINYEITKVLGTLTVSVVSTQIVITANSDSKEYDGTPLTNAGYTFNEGVLAEGDVLTAVVEGSQTDADSSANIVKSYKVMRGDKDVTRNYTFGASQPGTLTVTKRAITLTSANDSKMYDAHPLTNDTVTVSAPGFVAGQGATYTVTGSQTGVGSSENTFSYDLNEGTNPNNYDITVVYGTLTVSKNSSAIVIKANSNSKIYDGTPLTDAGYTFTQNILAEGDVLTAVVEGTQTDAGSTANVVTSYKVMRGDKDITDYYTFGDSVSGTLTVAKRKVILSSESADKQYDRTPLTRPDVTVSGDGFVKGEVSNIRATGSITDVGSVPNTIEYSTGENFKPGNYEIEENPGTLIITANETEVVVYIRGNGGEHVYDGTEYTVTGYTVTKISNSLYTENDFEFSGNASVSATDANSAPYKMGLSPDNFSNINGNFSKVTFVVEDGLLAINPRKVTLASESASKEYDGTPLTRPNVTVSGDGFVKGEVSNIRATGTITFKGEVDNTIAFDKSDSFKAGNYDITEEIGRLGISYSSKELKVIANSNSWEYDGKTHADGGYTVTFGDESYTVASGESATLSTGDTVTAVITKQVKNVADSSDGNNAIVTLTIGNAEQYSNTAKENGTLTITAKPLTITADSDEKVYDGHPLTKNSFSNTDLAEGDKLSASVTGSQTNVGHSDNVVSDAVIMAGEENVTLNYTITYNNGTLNVTPVTDEVVVTITEHGGSYLYDGSEKVVTGYDTGISNPLYTSDDFRFSGNDTVRGTNAGSYAMELVPENFENISNNFSNVKFIIVDNTLEIAQRKVVMTSATDEKIYDGTPLTNDKITVTGDGFADGEGAEYDVTGSRLDAGSSPNSFSYELNENTNADNYVIETNVGTLLVKQIPTAITITAGSDEKMYDGSALTNSRYTYTSNVLVDGDVLVAVVEGSQLNAGSSANVVTSYKVMRGEADVTANYIFAAPVDGKLTVTVRKIVMTSATDEKVYDNTPLTNDEITVTGDGFIEGEGAEYDVTGSQLDVGSCANSFTYKLTDGTIADNYEIETVEGKLTVTSPKQHIVITANSAEKTYDGTPLTDGGFTYTDFVLAEGDVLEAVVEGSQTDAGESLNVVKSYRVMRGDEDVTANYIFGDPVDGTLTVTKRKVTLTSGTACKIYDGEYLTCNKVEVGGDGFVEGEGATYNVTGKRKDVGWSYNDFTYTLNDNTKAGNYEITVERGFLYVKDQAEKPKTGDSSDLLLLLALMSMSGAGAAGTVFLYRRKREEQE